MVDTGPGQAKTSATLARFQREAELLAALNHPHIAQIYGLAENAGVRALVMELVEGEPLAARIARGTVPLNEALPLAQSTSSSTGSRNSSGSVPLANGER